jgi:hypothetical protein
MGYGGTILIPRSPHGKDKYNGLINYAVFIIAHFCAARYKVSVFNLAQFYLILKTQPTTSGKYTCYSHSGHYMPKNRTRINFQNNDISV